MNAMQICWMSILWQFSNFLKSAGLALEKVHFSQIYNYGKNEIFYFLIKQTNIIGKILVMNSAKILKFSHKIIAAPLLYSFSDLSHNAISPLDGRYIKSTSELRNYFSEAALMKYRVKVEAEWLLHLLRNDIIKHKPGQSTQKLQKQLQKLWKNFDDVSAQRIKIIEKSTNHDLKSVEYFIKENISEYLTYIHFCCTSQDINNLAYSLMLSDSLRDVFLPTVKNVHSNLVDKSVEWASDAMLGRTHGQPATPTTLGKQYANFAYRIGKQIINIENVKLTGKFSGAVGNFNAHYFAYPQVNWRKVCQNFVEERLNLQYNPYTTQIQSHDSLARLFSEISILNTILLGLCKDTWQYTSKGYLKQKIITGEVGSSTMPHKVNPIDFENCQGNLGIANANITFFAQKLPISRLQRDLSDSTVLRNQGLILGFCQIAYKSLLKGLSKVTSNKQLMHYELSQHMEVITQAIQTQLRKVDYPEAYQLLKKLSRDQAFDKTTLQKLTNELKGKINQQSLQKIANLRPQLYLGKAEQLARQIKKR